MPCLYEFIYLNSTDPHAYEVQTHSCDHLHAYIHTKIHIYIYINVSIYIIFNWAPGLHVCLRMFTFCSQASSLFGNCKWLCWHIYGIRIFIAVNMNAFIFLPWYPSLIRPPLRLWLRLIVAHSFPTSQTTRQIFSKKTKQINVFYFNSYFLILYISLCMYVHMYVTINAGFVFVLLYRACEIHNKSHVNNNIIFL